MSRGDPGNCCIRVEIVSAEHVHDGFGDFVGDDGLETDTRAVEIERVLSGHALTANRTDGIALRTTLLDVLDELLLDDRFTDDRDELANVRVHRASFS